MTRTRLAIASAAVVLLFTLPASAQVPPFFGGGVGIFDPEIDVVESGMLLDAQAVVSANRKYVTMTMRPQSTQLLSLQEFTFQTGGGQALGGGAVNGAAAGAGAGFGAAAADDAGNRRGGQPDRSAAKAPATPSKAHGIQGRPYPSPRAIANRDGVPLLEKPGMTLVGRVGRGTGR